MKLPGVVIIRPRRLVAAAMEALEHGDPCSACGAWRCPQCRYLILDLQDHHTRCPRRRWVRP